MVGSPPCKNLSVVTLGGNWATWISNFGLGNFSSSRNFSFCRVFILAFFLGGSTVLGVILAGGVLRVLMCASVGFSSVELGNTSPRISSDFF